MNELMHYGLKRRSGRYPWGSGERPYQSASSAMAKKGVKKKQEIVKKAFGKDLTPGQASSQNKDDGKGVTIQKGKTVQHITGIQFNKIRPGQLYVTGNDYDNQMYKAFLGTKLKNAGYKPASVSLTLSQDLKAPSAKEQFQIFQSMLSKHPEQIESDISKWLSNKGKDANAVKKVTSDRELYDLFINSIEQPSNSQRNFYNALKRSGYNAVLDEHDITGSWMQAKKPLILMDALSMVSDISIEELDTYTLRQALDNWIYNK